MKSKTMLAFAIIAGAGVSACSPMSQTTKPTTVSVTPQSGFAPYGQQTNQTSSNWQNPANQQTRYPSTQRMDNDMPMLSRAELQVIGDQIFKNEGGGNVSNLVHWNDGEDFASMGIGHFTWYPAGRSARFGNTFPELLDYMQSKGVNLPAWLQHARHNGAPWRSKGELMAAKGTPQVQELQNLLYQTRDLQTQYIVDRTRRAMPRLVNSAPDNIRPLVAQNLNAVANTPGGWYALIDYTNFKGEGLNRSGGYKGQNWGLLQVLEDMRPTQAGPQALNEFANAGIRVLERRVRNSPPERNEAKWMAGWSNRLNTYRRMLS